MSFFVAKDARWFECRDPSASAAVLVRLRRHAAVMVAFLAAATVWYAANVAIGAVSIARTDGTIVTPGVLRTATIARDGRGVPHIAAATLHDLFFAQGFAEASDRLFQMDLARRYAYGRLSEVFGARALPRDEEMRAIDIAGIAHRQWLAADPTTRRALDAFSAGANAAIRTQPLPVEFRMLLYHPRAWAPEDSIAVATMAALELSDSWQDVLARDEAWHKLGAACYAKQFPLSDPRYDVAVDGTRSASTSGPAPCASDAIVALHQSKKIGSNAWAAGAARSRDRGALIANDPHVDISIPGIWYVLDLRAPGFHAAGATLPGLPGIVLGHNERVAWAATNAQVATTILYRGTSHARAHASIERFHVRFSRDVVKRYYRGAIEFYVDDSAGSTTAVRWPVYWQRRTSITTLLALDSARNIDDATRALASYAGAPENFILADRTGSVAYHLAGLIPVDPAWGRYAHPLAALRSAVRFVNFDALPSRVPSRTAIALSANNKMYGERYPYRLSSAFEPPYRAARIASLLHARSLYDVAYFRAMQLDTFSPLDMEIVRDLDAKQLRAWNGRFDPDSRLATAAYDMRTNLESENTSLALLMTRLRDPKERRAIRLSAEGMLFENPLSRRPWSQEGAVDVEHPLSPMWYGFLRGRSLPGDGSDYTIHLQETGFAQGFRAVWDTSNWDAGGISVPTGESGEVGSHYYDDAAAAWIAGTLQPLPFSAKSVARSTLHVLTLRHAE